MLHELAQTIAQIQRQADHCAWLFQTHQLKTELRVAYATGVQYPWRLIETHRKAGEGVVMRRMHCFAALDALRKSIEERSNWKRQDRALVASQLPGTRMVSVPPSSASLSSEGDVSIELASLDQQRRELRERLCITKPDRIINLSSTPKFSTTRPQHL